MADIGRRHQAIGKPHRSRVAQMKRKGQPLLPEVARARLVERLRERFKLRGYHPPEKLFGATEQEVRIGAEIDQCFPPFSKEWWKNEPPLPKQVELVKTRVEEEEHHRVATTHPMDDSTDDDWGYHHYKSAEDRALGVLLASDADLDPETRAYIISKYLTKNIYFGNMISRDRKHSEFAETIKRVKRLLKQSGLAAHEADQAIADDLRIEVGALLKRLTRAPE